MKFFVTFLSWSLVIGHLSFADVYLRDVPEGHWAYDAVYDLIKLGVTGGFPDGTYRGNRPINRFEIASFLSKLAQGMRRKSAVSEKLLAELNTELAEILHQRKKEPKLSGELVGSWKAARAAAQQGGKASYRLKLSYAHNFADAADVRVNCDTMDSGFYGGSRNLASQLLDAEGNFKFGWAKFKIAAGPNEIVHFDDGLFPSENNLIYVRPERSVSVSTASGKTGFSLAYIIHNTDVSGEVNISEINGALSYLYPFLKLTLSPTLFHSPSGEQDLRLKLEGENSYFKFLLGAAKFSEWPHGLYSRVDLEAGENVRLVLQRVGSQYRERFGHSILDLFDRALADGSTQGGLELFRPFDENWFTKIKGNYLDPGAVLTAELRVGYRGSEKMIMEFFYQAHRAAQYSDLVGWEVNHKL